MREILFRGRRKHGSEWLYGDLNHLDGSVYIMPRNEDTPPNSPDWFEVDANTIGQLVGIPDRGGTHVYEGDIIKFADCHKSWVDTLFQVVFTEGAFVAREIGKEHTIGTSFINYADGYYKQKQHRNISESLIVVGNIHNQ